jgi:hypothetical protein
VTNYQRGRAFEYRARDKALKLGAVYVMRAASSKGAADLIAVFPPPASWLAGVYDGEGSTTVNRATKSGSDKVWTGLLLSISQKDRRLLDRVQEQYGGRISGPVESSGVHQWRISGAAALELLSRMYPFLSPQKREQADDVLERLEMILPPAPLTGTLLIQCKRDGRLPKAERETLIEIAAQTGAIPVLARVPKSGRGVEFINLYTKEPVVV